MLLAKKNPMGNEGFEPEKFEGLSLMLDRQTGIDQT